jgi:hypothetical protein
LEAQQARRRRRVVSQRNIAVAAACLAVIGATATELLRPPTVDQAAIERLREQVLANRTGGIEPPVETPMSVPSALTVPINLVPIDPNAPIAAHSDALTGYPTSIEFTNNSGDTAHVYAMASVGPPVLEFPLGPGETRKALTYFGIPWLATDAKGRSLGLIFPPANPSTASIPPASFLSQTATDPNEYLGETYLKPLTAAGAETPGSQRLLTAIEFVNLTGQPMNVYRRAKGGVRNLVQVLSPGANYSCGALVGDRWLVTDAQYNVLGVYEASPSPMTAVVTPP